VIVPASAHSLFGADRRYFLKKPTMIRKITAPITALDDRRQDASDQYKPDHRKQPLRFSVTSVS
jgi:hypothetical protein